MRLATLIVNPVAGRARLLRSELTDITWLLSEHGYSAQLVETSEAPDSARQLATAAAAVSSLVLACGGDGTVHGVVQGLAHSQAVLGVIPLGTANALARNLDLPIDPLAAVRRLMTYSARRIPLGEVQTAHGTRLFAVMAGCGPDGLLVHTLSRMGGAQLKARFGRAAYYGHAARLFLTRRWPEFQVQFRAPESDLWVRMTAVAVMASRVPNLGGIFNGTTPRARMDDQQLHVQILRGPGWLSLPAWMLCGRLGLPNPLLRSVDVCELRCEGPGVYAQADAEGLGLLPMSLRVIPDALCVLMPSR